MSRLGKKPIPAPNGVTVTVTGQDVSVKGPKGTLNFRAHDDVEVAFGNGEISVKPGPDRMPRSAGKVTRTRTSCPARLSTSITVEVAKGFIAVLSLVTPGTAPSNCGASLTGVTVITVLVSVTSAGVKPSSISTVKCVSSVVPMKIRSMNGV